MQTATQAKVAPTKFHSTLAKARQPANTASKIVGTDVAATDTPHEESAHLGYSFDSIRLFPSEWQIQPSRLVESALRLPVFRPIGQGRANPASVIPAGWIVPRVQAKLTVEQPNDSYEREAEHASDQILRIAETRVETKRACRGEADPDGECAACKAQRLGIQRQTQNELAEEENIVQAQLATEPSMAVPDLERRLGESRGSGQTLPEATRSSMESAFGADFGGVRVHTDGEAVQMNRELSAQAFTHGSDIYFNAGKYEPGSAAGKGLLAHELTHVMQQMGGKTTHDISQKALSIQRSVSTLCNAPSHWGMAPTMWEIIGVLAHLIGMNDYLTRTGGTRGTDVYLDTFELLPIDPSYAGFIIRNNPSLAAWKQVFLSVTPLKRPDYMIHRPGLTEFDELKPDSITGVLDGITKIYEIAGVMRMLRLPYRFGTSYTPTSSIPLFSTVIGGVPVSVSLKFQRKRSGLIVYELCITTDWALVAKTALVAAIVAILIIILRGLPIPVPVPAVAGLNADQGNSQESPDFTASAEISQLA